MRTVFDSDFAVSACKRHWRKKGQENIQAREGLLPTPDEKTFAMLSCTVAYMFPYMCCKRTLMHPHADIHTPYIAFTYLQMQRYTQSTRLYSNIANTTSCPYPTIISMQLYRKKTGIAEADKWDLHQKLVYVVLLDSTKANKRRLIRIR